MTDAQAVYDKLRAEITSGTLAPGSHAEFCAERGEILLKT